MIDSSQLEPFHLRNLYQNKPERPGWSTTFGATCAEAAAVCLEERRHRDLVTLQIDGMQGSNIEILWDAVDDTVRRFNADREVAT